MKKKGFTLIELLAVIIILAVVALIATPIVLNVIDDARKSAAESEANLVLKGINSYCEQIEMKKELGDGLDEGDIDCNPENEEGEITLTDADLAKMVSNLDDGTTVTAKLLNGKVSSLTVNSNTKEVVYNTETGKMEVQDDEAVEEPEEEEVATITQNVDTIGNVVYYNVTAGAECTATEQAANTDTNAGCMKFYVLDNTDANTVDLVLDHAVGERTPIISNEDHAQLKGQTYEEHVVQGCPEGVSLDDCQICGGGEYASHFYHCPEFGPVTILKKLQDLTKDYKGTQIVPDTEEFTYTDSTYNYTVSMAGLKARFMTRSEFLVINNNSIEMDPSATSFVNSASNYFVFPIYQFSGFRLFDREEDGTATYVRPVITLNKAA